MKRSPKNLQIAFSGKGLTHFGGFSGAPGLRLNVYIKEDLLNFRYFPNVVLWFSPVVKYRPLPPKFLSTMLILYFLRIFTLALIQTESQSKSVFLES